MIRKFICAIPLVLASYSTAIYAEEEIMIIDSNLADYDGKKIVLNGNVIVEHELGKISANQVTIYPGSEERKMRFALLQMIDQVSIALKDGGQLSCACAELDFRSGTGKFSGNAQQEYVIYTESLRDKANIHSLVPLVVKSLEMTARLGRNEAANENSPKSFITIFLPITMSR